jgi:hypothetical protein
MGGYPSGYYGSNYGSSNYGGGYGQPDYSSAIGMLSSLFSQPAYYPQVYQPAPQYIPVPVAQSQVITQPQYIPGSVTGQRRWANRARDRNGNGIPDWQERRANRSG